MFCGAPCLEFKLLLFHQSNPRPRHLILCFLRASQVFRENTSAASSWDCLRQRSLFRSHLLGSAVLCSVTQSCLTLQPSGPKPPRLLRPWDSPGKNTGVGCHSVEGQPQRFFSSVLFSHSVVSSSLRPHEPQHARPPCSSPTPGVYPNSCPLSQ